MAPIYCVYCGISFNFSFVNDVFSFISSSYYPYFAFNSHLKVKMTKIKYLLRSDRLRWNQFLLLRGDREVLSQFITIISPINAPCHYFKEIYRAIKNYNFNLIKCWLILKSHPLPINSINVLMNFFNCEKIKVDNFVASVAPDVAFFSINCNFLNAIKSFVISRLTHK